MAKYTALLDACVLYSAPLRDLLVNLARTDLFRARWTESINDEWTGKLRQNRPDLPVDKIERTRFLLNRGVPDCLITGHESIVETLELPDPGDRHVLAAAICGRADVIVTYNLADFPEESLSHFGIDAQHPDEFVVHLLHLDEPLVCAAIKRLRESLKRPPTSAEEYLSVLEGQSLAITAAMLRPFTHLI